MGVIQEDLAHEMAHT